MITLVFLLEEMSAKALLKGLLPRLLPMDRFLVRYVVFQGKQDLEKQLVRKIRGWVAPNTHFVVLRDQDGGDCEAVKRDLVELCEQAKRSDALVRIACREIESWYIGDLSAVETALHVKGLASRQEERKFRAPDRLAKPSTVLEKLTGQKYRKVCGSRAIAPYLDIEDGNRSHSFQVFVSGVRSLAANLLSSEA